ncbi:MAG: DUF5681 domain-containing protein [Bradyrhizobium sp.]
MANDQDGDRKKKSPLDEVHLSKETIEQAKNAILHGVGYQHPPQHRRFKEGHSGNPKGRPKRRDLGPGGSRSANAIALNEAERPIGVREGAQTREMPAIDAVFRKQIATALGGNAYAQKHAIERYDRAELERRQRIAEEIEFYTDYVETRRAEIAEARAKGHPVPDPLPHPDDVVIDPEKGVRFIGPFTEEGRAFIEENARVRDLLIMQDALDRRMAGEVHSANPLDQPGSALAFAQTMNAGLPERYRLSEIMFVICMDRYATWSKRKLLKEVYRAWWALGVRVPRGRTFPPLRFAKQTIDEIVEILTSGNDEDMARFIALPLHIQIDAMGITRREHREGHT